MMLRILLDFAFSFIEECNINLQTNGDGWSNDFSVNRCE
jgi:hypothetical protein